jgi:hypothetical protein
VKGVRRFQRELGRRFRLDAAARADLDQRRAEHRAYAYALIRASISSWSVSPPPSRAWPAFLLAAFLLPAGRRLLEAW